MRRLTDGERDIRAEQERDARECEEAMAREEGETMNELWLCCEDLNRDVEEQRVAFGPFKTEREAHAFGWALSYADGGELTYQGFKVVEDTGSRPLVWVDPQLRPENLATKAWDEVTIRPGDEPPDEHDDSGYQCAKDLADDRL